jgi:heat shock protein HslJ
MPVIQSKRFFHKDRIINLYLFILICCLTGIEFAACTPVKSDVRHLSIFDGISFKSGRVPSGIVRLVNGEYREKSSSAESDETIVHLDKHTAAGKIGQTDIAVAVLVSNVGTGEVYYDLVLMKKTGAGWEQSDLVELGDRVKIQSLAIVEDEIVVELKVHGPYDRECCSTLETVYRYFVSDGRMVRKLGPADFSFMPELLETLWKWQETYYKKSDTYVQSYDPNAYTIQLKNDGSLNVRADCNMAGGKYVLNGEYLNFQITHSTMAACPPESLSEKFLADLKLVDRYYFKSRKLYVVLKGDSGVMVFSF